MYHYKFLICTKCKSKSYLDVMNWTTIYFIFFHFASFVILVYWIDHPLHQQLKQMKKPAMKGQLSALFNLKSIKARNMCLSEKQC